MRYLWVFLGLAGLCGLTACATNGGIGSRQPCSTEIYTNAATGFYFPPAVDGFFRGRVTIYNPNGDDVGVGYDQPNYLIAVTVFIYPIPAQGPDSTFEEHFRRCEATVFKQHSDVKLALEQPAQVWDRGVEQTGKRAVFTYQQEFASRQQAVRSEMCLFKRGNHYILYRMTYPAAVQPEAEPDIRFFLEDFAWP